jgi:hypothetical protein
LLRGRPSRAPRLAWRAARGRIEELPNGHPQGARQPQERVKRQVYPAGLDTLKLSHVDAKALGRDFLGPCPALSDLAHTSAEVLASATILRIHGRMFRARGAR